VSSSSIEYVIVTVGLALYHSGQCDVHLVGMRLDVDVRSLVYMVHDRAALHPFS
jgi:hypothetical protein